MTPAMGVLDILYIARHAPHGPAYGAQQRVLHVARALGKVGRVSVALVLPPEIDEAQLAATREEFRLAHVARLRTSPLHGLAQRLRHELDPMCMNTHGEHVTDPDRLAMLALMDRHDIVWVHTIRTANALRIARWPRSVLDIDDLPSAVYRTGAQSVAWRRTILDRRMSVIWSRRERALCRRFDILAVCSEGDRAALGGGPRVHVVCNGFAAPERSQPRQPATPPRLGFIGLLDYPPNARGMQWFVERVWPQVKRELPTARLRLVGRGELPLPDAADVDRLGYVTDAAAEIATWSAMIVPIRTGGGTRMKILDAFSKRCPVVSTAHGAYGYGLHDGQELLLADDPEAFAAACARLVHDGALATQLAATAWRRFLRQWTWDAVARSVENAAYACASGQDAPPRRALGLQR